MKNLTMIAIVLALCAAVMAVSCGGSRPAEEPQSATKQLQSNVKKTIDDPERQKRVLRLVDELDSALFEFAGSLIEAQGRFTELDQNYQSPSEDFEALGKEVAERRQKAVARYIDVRMQMRAELSEEEWVQINAPFLEGSK